MASADGRCWVTYNGEIYNYLELRRELEALGAAFRTASDTEVLLEAYRHWGTGMLTRLNGMFAFAILDLETRRVLLARDQFGIKPLYLSRTAQGLAFASEIKALLRLPGVGRRGNAERAYQYLRYGERDAAPPTLFQDVAAAAGGALPAGRSRHVARGGSDPILGNRPRATQRRHLRRGRRRGAAPVRRVGRLHLRSDVPVGSCLSGGTRLHGDRDGGHAGAGPARPDAHLLVHRRRRGD